MIELGKRNIEYRPHTNIKAYALADFLLEICYKLKSIQTIMAADPSEPEAGQDIWELHIDGSARKKGSRVLKYHSDD